jgi:hypothetical protein
MATNSLSHPSPTLLPSHLIAQLHLHVPSYITMKSANLTLDDKMPEVSSDLSHQSFDLNHLHHDDKLIRQTNQATFEFEFSSKMVI